MDKDKEITRLQGMVQWYSQSLQAANHSNAKLSVENAMLAEQLRLRDESQKEAKADAKVSPGTKAG